MKSTIDSAGRIVIPRHIRAEAGLNADTPVEIRVRGGVVEIEPAPASVRFVKKGRLQVAIPQQTAEPLKEETVARVRRRLRKDE